MYGLVNKAIKDLVIEKFGAVTWSKICKDAGFTGDEFVPMQTYDDKLTYDLVKAASKNLNLSQEAVLRTFGQYWILFTAKEGYGEVMDLFGQNFDSCLMNLNSMHSRMGTMMPNLKPPRFEVVTDASKFTTIVKYYSKRPGLSPMVHGLLEGLAEKFKIKISIVHEVRAANQDFDTFHVKKVS